MMIGSAGMVESLEVYLLKVESFEVESLKMKSGK